MKKRGLCILLSGMMIFSSAPYGGTKEVKAAGEGESQTSAETVKEENTETEATSFEKTVVYEQDGITVTITDFKHNTLYYTVKNESEKEIFAEVIKIEVNGQVIRDILNEKDSVYQGLSVVETGAASGEEKEVNRNLFELDELQIKEFEEIGLGLGIIEVTGDKNNPMERRYSEIACTDTITVKTLKGDAAEDPMNEFGVTGEQMEQLGKYGFLRRDYLKNFKNFLYQVMLLQDTIGERLFEVEKVAREREDVIPKQLEEKEPLPDKEADQMAWVRVANQHRTIAEEIILKELIYV